MGMRTGLPNLRLGRQLGLVCGLLCAGNAIAARWEADASIAPSIAYTDNVCLSKDNKQSDWTGVGLVTPSGSVAHKTRKSSFSAHGSVQINTLTNSELKDKGCSGQYGDRERFFPNITALGHTQLIDDWVKLNASLVANQSEVTSALPRSADNLDRNGNTNTYYRYSISPVLTHRLKNNARYTLKYSYDEQYNTSDAVSDSNRNALSISIASGRNSRVSWDLSGNYSRVDYYDEAYNPFLDQYVERESSELKSAGLSLGYQFNRRWQVNGRTGWEWNDFRTFNGEDPGGSFWDLGVRWTPSERTSVELGTGDRFFGTTPRLNVKHKRKRSLLRANYQKTITYQNDINSLGNAAFYGNMIEGGLILDPDNPFIVGQGANSSIYSNGPILDERGTVGYTYTGRRLTTDIYGSYSQQTRADDGAEGVFKNVTISFSPQISRTYSLTGSISWDDDDPLGYRGLPGTIQDFGKSSAWYYTIQVGRPLNDRMNATFNYQFTDRQSDSDLNEYQENRFIATLTINL